MSFLSNLFSDMPKGFTHISPEHYSTFTVLIKNIPIHYAKVGNGPSLVFIHGLTNNWYGWGRLIPELEQHFTLFLLDLPGYGDSGDMPDGEYSIQQQAQFVSEFIQRIVPDKPIVIGLSMGSLITAEVGKIMQDALSGIVLIGGVFNIDRTTSMTKRLKQYLTICKDYPFVSSIIKRIVATRWFGYAANKFLHMHLFKRYLSDLYGLEGRQKMRKEAFVGMGISVADYMLEAVLETVRIPVLLLYGQYDKVSNPITIKELPIIRQQNITLGIISDAGHIASVEKPKEVTWEIANFARNTQK